MNNRIDSADADHDGKITVAELASGDREDARRADGQAHDGALRRTNGDGALTKDEVAGRQKKMFAFLDRNDDGKIEKSEMPHRGGWRDRDWK